MKYLDITKKDIETLPHLPVILSIGATEQHAEHLPLGTDTYLADYLLEVLNKNLDEQILTLPSQWIGLSEEHKGFFGTLSLSAETLRSYISDLASWLQESDFSKFIIINTHGGNEYILKEIEDSWNKSNKLKIIVYEIWSPNSNKLTQELFGGIDVHAGDSESSITCAIRPDLVKEGVIKDGYLPQDKPTEIKGFHQKTKTGVINFKADIVIDKTKGEQLLELLMSDLVDFIKSL